jgi:hypothetical protein
VKRLGEEISLIVLIEYIDNINEQLRDTVTDEVLSNGDVLHLTVRMRIMRARNSSLVVAKDGGWKSLARKLRNHSTSQTQ